MFKRQRKISKRAREIQIEDIFLDKLLKEQSEKKEIATRKIEVPLKRSSFVALLLLAMVVLGVMLSYTFFLQIWQNEKYNVLAEENKFIIFRFTSERGIIYDSKMNPLVSNQASFDLWNGSEIEKENLTHQEIVVFETKNNKDTEKVIKKRILRTYVEDTALAHILGYTGKISPQELADDPDCQLTDYTGREGIERSYQEVLKEKKGELQVERTAQGEEISSKIISYPKSGDSLVLSLDLALQKKAVSALSNVLEELSLEKGVVIALDPRNGDVLASVSLPQFDNNLFAHGISQEELQELNQDENNPQLNRVMSGLYPTGSTIKPMIALAALEEGLIDETTQLYCPEELCLEHKYTGEGECFKDWQFHGWTDIKRALAESVNPFFYMLGGGYQAPARSSQFFVEQLPRKFEGLGVERIDKYLELFGFGTSTQIDLVGELAGRVPSPEWKESYFKSAEDQQWYLGDTYNLSIGQGYLLATPLQLAQAFSVIANKGTLFQPQLLKAVLPADSGQREEAQPKVIRENIVSQESLEIVREGMRQSVALGAGSAYPLSYLPVKVAAKTGTAEIYPAREIYHNWITVFGPYDNPEIVLVVLVEEVEGMRRAARTVAQDILQWYFSQ